MVSECAGRASPPSTPKPLRRPSQSNTAPFRLFVPATARHPAGGSWFGFGWLGAGSCRARGVAEWLWGAQRGDCPAKHPKAAQTPLTIQCSSIRLFVPASARQPAGGSWFGFGWMGVGRCRARGVTEWLRDAQAGASPPSTPKPLRRPSQPADPRPQPPEAQPGPTPVKL